MPTRPAYPERRFASAGRWWNRLTALVLALWATHSALRIALLVRPDAFGFPLVGKAEWYLLHAFFIDLHWIALSALPFAAAIGLAARVGRSGAWILAAFALFHAPLLLLTVADHETMRFMGMHLDPGMLRTYGNLAALRETVSFVAHDAAVPWLSYILFLGCVPAAAILWRLLLRLRVFRSAEWKPLPVVALLAACALGYVYVYHLWTGGHRMARLRPVAQVFWDFLRREDEPALEENERERLTERYRALWRGGEADSDWIFPSPDYPYYRVPVPGSGPEPDPDETPWNFVLLILESHRALHTGHLVPYGALDSATPFLDSLARANHYWTRMVAGGLPTINALLSIHLSIPQHPTRQIAGEFTALRHEAFTAVLGRHGWFTRFFSAADPAWDNQTPWLRQWYGGVRYHRSRETDAAMFADMAAWLRDSLPEGRPFFVTAMTKTNHYPFNPVPGVRNLPDTASLVSRMSATMAYTDSALRAFFAEARRRPWFDRTVFIVVADHGFPLSEHGSSQIGHGLYAENIWIPLVIAGAHPLLGPPRARHEPASQLDLAPTLLELAGVRAPNAFMGHSLLSPPMPERRFLYGFFQEQAFVENGPYRWHGAWGRAPRPQGEELFDVASDRLERHDLLAAPDRPRSEDLPRLRDALSEIARDMARLHMDVIERNALLPPSLSDGKKPAPETSLDALEARER